MEKTTDSKQTNPTSKPMAGEPVGDVFAPLNPAAMRDAKSIQAAQRLIGNQAVQRLLQRDPAPDTAAENAPDTSTSAADPMHLWLSRGPMPGPEGMDVVGAGSGGFNARFEPSSRTLEVNINIGFTLLNGLNVDTSTGLVTPNVTAFNAADTTEAGTIAQLTAAATNLNGSGLTPAEKVNIVQTQWQWASGESDTWLPQYQHTVESAWSGRHFFQCQEFPQLLANVSLHANVHLGAQRGDHTAARIVKTPPQQAIGAYVAPGQANNPNDQGLVMSSAHVNPSPNSLLQHQLRFEHNSSNVATARTPNGTAGPIFIQQFKTSFDAASPTGGPPIRLIGRASAVGDAAYNERLAGERAANVESALRAAGIVGDINRMTSSSEGETGASDDAEWRRVDIIVGSGEAQVVGAHEFGHMIGLGDEYATTTATLPDGSPAGLITGTGNAPGTAVAHNDVNNNRLGDQQIDGAVAENNDNIMSLGNTVRPQHYSTFHNALQIVTGKTWTYGGEGNAPDIVPGMTTPGGGVIT
jgi:outer membrane protein OmpA-like peptidoglycan-associated protein